MSTHANEAHPERHIEEDAIATPLIALITAASTLVIVAVILALIGLHYQASRELDAERFAEGDSYETLIERKEARDLAILDGYYEDEDPGDSRVIVPVDRGIDLFLLEEGN